MEEDFIVQGELIYYAHLLSTKFKQLDILPIGDAHYGNPLFSMPHFLNTLRKLEKPTREEWADFCEPMPQID